MAAASRYADRVKESVESLINCLICTDRFEEPKVLPCQHTFCLPCLEHFYKSYNDSRIISVSNFPCPQCRKSVYLPVGGLPALPTDFKVGQIREVFDRMNIAGSQQSCDICRFDDKIVNVTSFCAQCSKHLCEGCMKQHANSTIFRGHSTVAIDSQQKDELTCPMHKEVVKYFCQECKLIICTVCALAKHSKHDTLDLATAMDTNRTSIQNMVETLKANLVLYENRAEKFALLSRGRKKHVEKLRESVKKQTRLAIAKIREEEGKVKREIDSMENRMQGDIDKEIDIINVQTREIRTLCDATDAFLGKGISLELINKYESVVGSLNIFLQPPTLDLPDKYNEEIAFEPSSRYKLGKLSTRVNTTLESDVTNPVENQPKASGRDSEESQKNKKKQPVPEKEDTAASKKKGGDNVLGKLRKFAKLADGNGACLSVTPDKTDSADAKSTKSDLDSTTESLTGSDEACSMTSSRCTTHRPKNTESQAESIPRFQQTDITQRDQEDSAPKMRGSERQRNRESTPTQYPAEDTAGARPLKPKDKLRLQWKTVDNALSRSVAFLADGTSVATEYSEDSDKLQLYDSDGNLIKCVTCSGQNIVKPWGCAVNHQINQIVITDHGDRAVKVLDRDLSLKQTWRSLFEKPSGVAVMRNGDYVITDTAKSVFIVSIHTSSGIRKREFANKGSGTEELRQPQYVCTDHNDRIIISDAELNCIKIYDARGKMLLKFKAANDPPMQPHGVCIDAHNNILVADQANNVISLFSYDGLFIRNIAQLDEKPFGIAVHDNGSLAVATDASLHMLYVPSIRTW